MMNRPIEGVITAAERGRTGFGQTVFRGVVLRRPDGVEQRLGNVVVAEKLAHALAAGTQGRFCFHDMMGAQGLHAFTPHGGGETIAFPMLLERAFGTMALLNLAIVALWISWAGTLQLVPLIVGVLATTLWATCRGCREAILHDVKWERRVAAAKSHRQAVMRAPG